MGLLVPGCALGEPGGKILSWRDGGGTDFSNLGGCCRANKEHGRAGIGSLLRQTENLLSPGPDPEQGPEPRDGSCLILRQNCSKVPAPELINNNAAH